MQQCNACGGIYAPVLPDGHQYFHVCPPLSVVELAAAIAAGQVQLPPGETPDQAVTRRIYQRWNARDENVVASKDPAQPTTIKSAGAGVKPALVPVGSASGGVVVVGP